MQLQKDDMNVGWDAFIVSLWYVSQPPLRRPITFLCVYAEHVTTIALSSVSYKYAIGDDT